MQRVLIIEDEPLAAQRITKLLREVAPDLHPCGVIDSVEDGRLWFANQPPPHLILSDIQLADGLSFELLKSLPSPCPVIFTTAFDQYALAAFKANGVDYLLKPIAANELAVAIEKARKATSGAPLPLAELVAALHRPSYKNRFLIKNGAHLRVVAAQDVALFEFTDGLTFMFTLKGERHVVDFSLDQLESMLDPAAFHRINRQCIGAAGAITSISTYLGGRLKLRLAPDGREAVVARERVAGFKSWLGEQ